MTYNASDYVAVPPYIDQGRFNRIMADFWAMHEGYSPTGTLTTPYSFLINKIGADTYASANGALVYGGPSDAGGVNGGDSSAVILAARAAILAADGGHMHIKKGTYNVDTSFIISANNFHLTGEGIRNTILNFTDDTVPGLEIEGTVGSWLTNTYVSDLTLQGPNATNANNHGIHIRHASKSLMMDRVEVLQFGDWGMYIDGGVFVGSFNNMQLNENKGGGIRLVDFETYFPNANAFTNIYITGAGTTTVANCVVIESSCESNRFHQLHLENCIVTDALVLIKTAAAYNEFYNTYVADNSGTPTVFRLKNTSHGTRVIGGELGHTEDATSKSISIEDDTFWNTFENFWLIGNSPYAATITSSRTSNRVWNVHRSTGSVVRAVTDRSGVLTGTTGSTAFPHYLTGAPVTCVITVRNSSPVMTGVITSSTNITPYYNNAAGTETQDKDVYYYASTFKED